MTENTRPDAATWVQLREKVLDRDKHQCVNCGGTDDLEIHHIVPLHSGGTNTPSNLTTLCDSCHSSVHERSDGRSNVSTPESDVRELPTLAEIRSLVKGSPHPLHRAIVVLSAKTGIGVGELCNLNRADVYIGPDAPDGFHSTKPKWLPGEDPALRIRPSKESPHSIRRERSGESIIPFDGEIQKTLTRWLAVVPDPIETPRPFFISTADNWGKRLTPDIVHHMVETNARSLGLHEADNELGNLTSYALRCFFDQRFSGQLAAKEYILGRKSELPLSWEEFVLHYRKHIYAVSSSSPIYVQS